MVPVNADPHWEFAGAVPDGVSFKIGGLEVWQHEWLDTGERARVTDPQYHRGFTFEVYEIKSAGQIVTFAAGEFSNCMWGFYVRKSVGIG